MSEPRLKHRRTQSSSEEDFNKNQTQAILDRINEAPQKSTMMIEPLEQQLDSQQNSIFSFGRGVNKTHFSVQPNSSSNPYALNLKDNALFQIPELNDIGTPVKNKKVQNRNIYNNKALESIRKQLLSNKNGLQIQSYVEEFRKYIERRNPELNVEKRIVSLETNIGKVKSENDLMERLVFGLLNEISRWQSDRLEQMRKNEEMGHRINQLEHQIRIRSLRKSSLAKVADHFIYILARRSLLS